MTDNKEARNRQIPIVCPGHSRPLAGVEYSPVTPDGVFLISACHDKEPMLRNGKTGDWIGTFKGHKGAVWSAKLNKDATFALTGSGDFSAKVWDAITGAELYTFAHKHIVKTVEFSPDSRKFVSGGHEGKLRLFDLVEPEAPAVVIDLPPPSSGGTTSITKVIWDRTDSNRVITGTSDGKVRAWDLRSRQEIHSAEVQGTVMDLELSPTVGDILTICAGDKVTFLDASSLLPLKSFQMPMHFREEGGASLHPDRQLFIAGGSDLWVRVFDFNTGAELECHKGHHGPVRCLRYAPEGGTYATGSEDGTVRIWATQVDA